MSLKIFPNCQRQPGVPTPTQLNYLRQAKDALDQALIKFNTIFETDVTDFQAKVKQADFSLFPAVEKLDLNWEKEKN